jgi:urocanate hydratase
MVNGTYQKNVKLQERKGFIPLKICVVRRVKAGDKEAIEFAERNKVKIPAQ